MTLTAIHLSASVDQNQSPIRSSEGRSDELRSLRWYQNEGLEKFHDKHRAFFAMEMRLGKTLTAIRWILTQDARHVLIVAPKTVLTAWEEELSTEGLDYINLTTLKGGIPARVPHIENPSNRFLLINYESIPRMTLVLNGCDAIIADEITKIKNFKSKSTQVLLRWAKRAKYSAGLSGQPAPESWEEIWTQMAFSYGGEWMGEKKFWPWKMRYFKQHGFDWVVLPNKVQTLKAQFHNDAYVITRADAGLANEKIYEKIVGELSDEERSIYKGIEKTWTHPSGDETKFAMVVAGWYRRITSGVLLPGMMCWKYEEIIRLITTDLKNSSIVIWCSFRQELYLLWQLMKERKISATWMSGATSYQDRQSRIKAFQQGKRRIFLVQVDCGQFGIDLSTADTCIYASSPWSYEKRAQSEDRIFKVGKTSSLLVVDLVTKNTIDETVMESLKCKNSSAKFLLQKLGIKEPKGRKDYP
jgi:SNF2 family DNA or RNA helicase